LSKSFQKAVMGKMWIVYAFLCGTWRKTNDNKKILLNFINII